MLHVVLYVVLCRRNSFYAHDLIGCNSCETRWSGIMDPSEIKQKLSELSWGTQNEIKTFKDFYISGDRMPNTLSSDGKYFRWEPKQQEQQEQQHWAHPQKDKQLHYDWRVALMFCLKQGWLLCFFCKWLVTVIQDVHLLHFFILIQELQSIVCSMSSMVFKLYSSSVVK